MGKRKHPMSPGSHPPFWLDSAKSKYSESYNLNIVSTLVLMNKASVWMRTESYETQTGRDMMGKSLWYSVPHSKSLLGFPWRVTFFCIPGVNQNFSLLVLFVESSHWICVHVCACGIQRSALGPFVRRHPPFYFFKNEGVTMYLWLAWNSLCSVMNC